MRGRILHETAEGSQTVDARHPPRGKVSCRLSCVFLPYLNSLTFEKNTSARKFQAKLKKMATEAPQLPHLEVFNRVLELPVVEMALSKSAETYSKLKDSHWLVHWALTTAESSFESATRQAVPIAAPIARKLENPIHFVDHTLCLGLDKIEQRVPLVKEKPEQILANAYTLAVKKVQPAVTTICNVNDALVVQAANLRDLSWNKANQILETDYGIAAVKGLDNTAVLVDNLIDAYFPAIGEESQTNSITETEEEDKLLHTLQTVGRLSNKAAWRVYVNVIHRTRTLNKDSLRNYVAFLLEFLQLTQYIHAINEKVIDLTSPRKCETKKKTVNSKSNST